MAASILDEVFTYSKIATTSLLASKAATIYANFMDTPTTPKVTLRRPELPWSII